MRGRGEGGEWEEGGEREEGGEWEGGEKGAEFSSFIASNKRVDHY